jgi:HK97 family phage portal protein
MFLNIRADDSGDRSPWGDFWFSPIPFKGSAHQVTADAAMRLTAVYACVRVLCESVSTLPFVLYRKSANGGKTIVRDHWIYDLFGNAPNEFQNPMEYRETMQQHLSLRGNGLSQIEWNGRGEASALIPIHPDTVQIEMLSTGPRKNWRYVVTNADGSETPLTRGEVFHLRCMSPDGVVGMNPIAAARDAVATGLSAQDYGMRYFQNDATPGGWIEYPGQFKDDEQRRIFRDQWQRQQAGRNRHKTAVLEFGMKYHPIEVKNSDAQYLESRKFSRSEIATLFRVPPHMIGDLERATFSNIEQQSLEFVAYSLMPWLVRWESAIRFAFIDPKDNLEVEFPTLALLRGDAAARSTYYHNGILDGWMTRNEARVSESFNPLDGLDEPLRPLNMVEESDAEDVEDAAQQNPQTPAQDDAPTNDKGNDAPASTNGTDARLMALASASAERIARKEWESLCQGTMREGVDKFSLVDFYAKHCGFVAAVLNVSHEAAKAYCIAQIETIERNRTITNFEFADISRSRLERLAATGAL